MLSRSPDAKTGTAFRRLPETAAAMPGSRLCLLLVFVALQMLVCGRYIQVGIGQIWIKVAPRRDDQPKTQASIEPWEYGVPGFPMPSIARFRIRSLQDNWEAAAQKNFLVPEHVLVPIHRDIVLSSVRLSRSLIHTRIPRLPLPEEHTFFETEQRICGRPRTDSQADRLKLADRAQWYNHLRAAHPQVRFHVFPILRIADWHVVTGAYGVSADTYLIGDKYVRDCRAFLDASIGYAWAAEGLSGEQAASWYYRTDHHLNFEGAYKAYGQIWELLRTQNPQIGEPWRPQKWIELPDINFYGTYARRSGYFDRVHDVILDARFDLPELCVHVHGAKQQDRNKKNCYEAGDYSKAKFANHYAEYFGDDYGLIEYTCQAASGNLLVVGDSYDNCLEPLLASHFHRSYFVDLRHYAGDVGDRFVIDDFIVRNEITDVLFVGAQGRVLGLEPWEDKQ